ncbi:MAG: hypothetical protein ACJ71H_04690 [Nitrososphaeraceae archaeon]
MISRLTLEIVYYSHINSDLPEILGKISILLKINRLATRIALMIIISDGQHRRINLPKLTRDGQINALHTRVSGILVHLNVSLGNPCLNWNQILRSAGICSLAK